MSLADKTIKDLEKRMKDKDISGFVVIPEGSSYPALHAIEGNTDELIANIAFMAFHDPTTLSVLKSAVQIATDRLAGDLGPENKARQN